MQWRSRSWRTYPSLAAVPPACSRRSMPGCGAPPPVSSMPFPLHWINPKAKVNPGHSSNMALFGQKDDW